MHLSTFGETILLGSAVYHWVMGSLSMISVKWTRKMGRYLYALKIPDELDPRYEFVWKPLGVFAVFTAAIATEAWLNRETDPHFAIIVLKLLAVMYLLRASMRWIYRTLFERAFSVSLKRNLANIGFNLILAAAIFVFGFQN